MLKYGLLITRLHEYVPHRGWQTVEEMLNPNLEFKKVYVMSVNDIYDYSNIPARTLVISSFPPIPRIYRYLFTPLYYSHLVANFLTRNIKKYNLSLIGYFYGDPLNEGFPVVLAARKTGIPSFITLQNDYHRRFRITPFYLRIPYLNEIVERFVLKKATKIRCVSKFLTDYTIAHGINPKKIVYISNKVNIKNFISISKKEITTFQFKYALSQIIKGNKIILFAGRLRKQKNLERMLRALTKALKDYPQIFLLIAGAGPRKKELLRLAQKLRISKRVRFLGRLHLEELRCAYHISDFLLFPTLYEGQPRVVIEALSAGLPVIGSNYGPVPELVPDRIKGLLVNPLDIETISQAILKMARDDDFRERLSKNCVKNVNQFSFKNIGDQEVKFLKGLMDGEQR
ncbi:D-inositol-3-phosphate glycosyltransferase [subsurface metagenome]